MYARFIQISEDVPQQFNASKTAVYSKRYATNLKRMNIRNLLILSSLFFLHACQDASTPNSDYLNYHLESIKIETAISQEQYANALDGYENLFKNYEFIFLRDYKNASQLSFFLGEKEKGIEFLKKGIAHGWKLEDLKNNSFLKKHLESSEWKPIEKEYPNLRKLFKKTIDTTLRETVLSMFKKDQQIALEASLIEDDTEQENFISKNFPEHSESQLLSLLTFIDTTGYPGEKRIGNNFWMSTILSHHNSIAQEYNKRDTLYDVIRPKLFEALQVGQISPYEIALIEDWKKAVISDGDKTVYGYVNAPLQAALSKVNENRQKIGLRSIELRNNLVDIEQKTAMNFYLPDWVEGKIVIKQK